jgi:conjugal transfer ATP-binding protein TraC
MNVPFLKKKSANSAPTAPPPGTDAKNRLIQGLVTIQDIIAPEAIELDFNYLKLGDVYVQTLFVAGYPRFVSANWLAPLINFNYSFNISMHVYPVDGKTIMDELRRKITEMEAEIQSDLRRGRIANIDTQVKLEDARQFRKS